MARETLPRARVNKAPNGIPWGDPRWGRIVDKSEMDELIRQREGCVDDSGIRTVCLTKGDPVTDNPMLLQYRRMGYEVVDAGYEYHLKIAQSDFEKREKARMEADIAKQKRTRTERSEFSIDRDENVGTATLQDIMRGNIPDDPSGRPI